MPVADQEPGAAGQQPQAIKFMSMSAMQQFKTPEKSHEEIRYEDYSQGVKGNTVRAPAWPRPLHHGIAPFRSAVRRFPLLLKFTSPP